MIIGLKYLRSHITVGTIFLVVLNLFAPVAGFGQDAASLPGGVGRDLVSNKCVSCHALSTALVKRASEDEWEETVTRMVSTYMAPINDSDKSVILDYLSANFGEDSTYNPGQQMPCLMHYCPAVRLVHHGHFLLNAGGLSEILLPASC